MASLATAKKLLLLLATTLTLVRVTAAQGVAVTGQTARPSSLATTELPPPKVRFEDVAEKAGLDFQHVLGDPEDKTYILETTGSGVAVFDFDNDGLYDIFFVNGRGWNEPEDGPQPTSKLFRNRGGLRFEDVTEKSGFSHTGWGQGVCVGDYDDDGSDDLFVTYYGPNVLYRNKGDGTFRDATGESGCQPPAAAGEPDARSSTTIATEDWI